MKIYFSNAYPFAVLFYFCHLWIHKGMNNSLTRSDIKTLSLSSLGGALEFYDFIVFLTFIPILKLHFFPEQSELGSLMSIYGIYAVAYFVRPLSGIILAHFGDIVGRKRMFMLSHVQPRTNSGV